MDALTLSFMCTMICLGFLIWTKRWLIFRKSRSQIPLGVKSVPLVEGGLPFIGHGIAFALDSIGFVRKCYAKYGKVFKIKIFRKSMILVCDREYAAEYFKADEDKFSLGDILKMLYFCDAFSDEGIPVPRLQNFMHKTVAVRVDRFLPKIKVEAERCIARLEEQTSSGNQEINFAKEMGRFVISTSARCFIGIQLSDQGFKNLYEFNQLVNTAVISTYFLPIWAIKLIFGRRLASYRNKVITELEPEIVKYREDRGKNESTVLRAAVDSVHEMTGNPLTNREIGEIMICLLYVSSENTATGLTLSIVNLANHPEHWARAIAESRKFLQTGDIKGIMTSEYLHACVMETARLNAHIFGIMRKPREMKVLGEFFVGEVDAVAICVQMLHVHDSAEELFSDPPTYNPDRFLGGMEPMGSQDIMTWGSGLHLCPGRTFALYEIKMALACLLEKFQLKIHSSSRLNFFSTIAFGKMEVDVRLSCMNIKSEDK